jgi:hypothetical protein
MALKVSAWLVVPTPHAKLSAIRNLSILAESENLSPSWRKINGMDQQSTRQTNTQTRAEG